MDTLLDIVAPLKCWMPVPEELQLISSQWVENKSIGSFIIDEVWDRLRDYLGSIPLPKEEKIKITGISKNCKERGLNNIMSLIESLVYIARCKLY